MKVNRTELAEILGVSMPTITSWMGDSMPYVEGGGKGKPFVFETTDCIEWWVENKRRKKAKPASEDEADDGRENIEEAERRKMVAQADKAELELAKAAARVVEITDVATVIADMHVKVRTRLLSIGNKVRVRAAAHLGGDKKAQEEIVSVVEEVVNEAMGEIRDDPFAEEEGDDVPEEAPVVG